MKRSAIKRLRAVIGVFGTLTLGFSIAGLVSALRDPTLVGTNEVIALSESLGVPVQLFIVAGLVVPLATAAATATFVFLRRPRDPFAMIFSIMLISFASYTSRSLAALSENVPAVAPFGDLVTVVAFSTTAYFLLVFPDRRFSSRTTMAVWVACSVFLASRPAFLQALAERSTVAEASPLDRVYLVTFAVLILSFLVNQALRFRRATGEERMQMKWVIFPILAIATYVAVGIILPGLFFEFSPTWFGAVLVGSIPLAIAFPLCIARAVMRYRLYEIDLVINRTLTYGALTVILIGCYVSLVFALQALLSPFTARSDLAIAASTLAVAALFKPLEAQLQDFIDRRFYRRKFDVQETIDSFGARVRDDVDLASLRLSLERVVTDTMQPAHVSLWLRGAR